VNGAGDYAERFAGGMPAVGFTERLSGQSRLLEHVMLGLRLCEGFDLAAAEAECGCELRSGSLGALIDGGLLMRNGNRLCLTPAGYPLANQVVARLMVNADRPA